MASRPVVLPEPFDGSTSWEQWDYHFQNVAAVNAWNSADKLKWLKVRLTGRAQIAFQRLPEATKNDYDRATKALKERFEPASKKTRYQAELQTRQKKKGESWQDLAEDLRLLADKAFPELEDNARERLALNVYLAQLDHPQVAFGVKQGAPTTLDAAVSSTLELESYLTPKMTVASVETEEPEDPEASVGAVSVTEKLVDLVEKLVKRVEKLERGEPEGERRPSPVEQEHYDTRGAQKITGGPRNPPRRQREPVTCWRCGKKGHIAPKCRAPLPMQQEN